MDERRRYCATGRGVKAGFSPAFCKPARAVILSGKRCGKPLPSTINCNLAPLPFPVSPTPSPPPLPTVLPAMAISFRFPKRSGPEEKISRECRLPEPAGDYYPRQCFTAIRVTRSRRWRRYAALRMSFTEGCRCLRERSFWEGVVMGADQAEASYVEQKIAMRVPRDPNVTVK